MKRDMDLVRNKAKQAAGASGGIMFGLLKSVLSNLAIQAATKAAGMP